MERLADISRFEELNNSKSVTNGGFSDKLKRMGQAAALTAALSGFGTQGMGAETGLTPLQTVAPVMRQSMGPVRERSALASEQQQRLNHGKSAGKTIVVRYGDTPFVVDMRRGDQQTWTRIAAQDTKSFCAEAEQTMEKLAGRSVPRKLIIEGAEQPGDSQVRWMQRTARKHFPQIKIDCQYRF